MTNNTEILKQWIKYCGKYNNLSSISIGLSTLNETEIIVSGVYNKEDLTPTNEYELYSIASLTKINTAIEILKLEEKGLIDIDEVISNYLDYFPNKSIKIKNILTHSAGLPRDGDFNFWLTKEFPSEEELIKEVTNLKIDSSKIGTYKYSNLGYAILGLLLERFNVMELSKEEDLLGYGALFPDSVEKFKDINFKSFYRSFGEKYTIKDLSTFTKMLLSKDPALMSSKTWNKFYEIQLTKDNRDGICLPLEKWADEKVYEHTGHGFGFESAILIDFELNIGISILMNTTQENAFKFSRTIRRYLQLVNKNHLNQNSIFNGFYRSKNYDVLIYDFNDKLIMLKPSEVDAFHNYEEYEKVSENEYQITDKDDPYFGEKSYFKFDSNGNVIGFQQGGWGYRKLQPKEIDLILT